MLKKLVTIVSTNNNILPILQILQILSRLCNADVFLISTMCFLYSYNVFLEKQSLSNHRGRFKGNKRGNLTRLLCSSVIENRHPVPMINWLKMQIDKIKTFLCPVISMGTII